MNPAPSPATRFIGIDCETFLIAPGVPAPKGVCLSWAEKRGDVMRTGLHHFYAVDDAVTIFENMLEDPAVVFVGANIYYDLGILCVEAPHLVPLVFQAFEDGRFRDVAVRQKLRDIRDGCMKWTLDADGEPTGQRYALSDLEFRYFKRDRKAEKKGPDVWRLKYGTLWNVPIAQWPPEASEYAIKDSVGALEVFFEQYADDEPIDLNGEILPPTGDDTIHDELRQTKYQWALHLMSLWGVRTDGAAVDALEISLKDKAESLLQQLRRHAPEICDESGKRNMAAIYARVDDAYEGCPPQTETGRPATDGETLSESGDEGLVLLGKFQKVKKLISKDLKELKMGTIHPINARWNGLVESGRISCAKPNLANPPREGGVRECVVPRPGMVFVDIDLDTIEMRALAQVNIDLGFHSVMAEALRGGKDLHSVFAADMLGLLYEGFLKGYEDGDPELVNGRQFAKIGDFGFMGGMGARSLVAYAKGYGIEVTLDQAKKLHAAFKRVWSEMPQYFDLIKQWLGAGDGYAIQRRSNRIRGRLTFCKAANTMFQGLTADATKSALWVLCKACYLAKPGDALYGSRIVLFLYDQFVVETPELGAARAAEEVHRIVISTVKEWLPDVPVSGKPSLSRRFYKGVKPIRIDGQLVPSKPVLEGKKIKWVADLLPIAA